MIAGSLFSGIGLLDFGLALAGIEHRWLCERDEWRRGILAKRWPEATIFDDVRTLGVQAGTVDLLAGGFPCKGVSSAGKREGFGHPETVIWREFSRIIRELRPRYVLVENVAALLALNGGRLFGEVLGDLAESGYDCWWDCLPACSFGAPHRRDRVFIIAHADLSREDAHSPASGSRPAACKRAEHAPPTPTVGDSKNARNATAQRKGESNHHAGTTLVDALLPAPMRLLPTPNADDTRPQSQPESEEKQQTRLSDTVRLLPTPVAQDDNKTPEAHLAMKQRMGDADGSNRTQITSLAVLAKAGFKQTGDSTKQPSDDGKPSTGPPRRPSLRLNPEFVEWMMGAPRRWSDPDCLDLAMEFRCRQAGC